MVRLALAVGGYLSGSSCPSRRRNATSVVRSGDHAHHLGATWLVLAGYALGGMTSQPKLPAGSRDRCLVFLNNTAPSAMPLPPSAARSGTTRFLSCPGATGTALKFPASYRTAPQTLSPMPRDSIKSSLGVSIRKPIGQRLRTPGGWRHRMKQEHQNGQDSRLSWITGDFRNQLSWSGQQGRSPDSQPNQCRCRWHPGRPVFVEHDFEGRLVRDLC